MSLEERLLRLEDLQELQDLRARYCHLVDREQWAEAADLFAQDGQYVGGLGSATGPAAIAQLFSESVPGRMRRAWHHCHNDYSEVDGDVATGVASHELYYIMDDDARVAVGRYIDRYRRTSSGWKFVYRETQFDFRTTWHEGFSSAEALTQR